MTIAETIRISEKGKQSLIQLKRKTGIQNWNILCRWALCLSLAEKSIPPFEEYDSLSNIEMSWKTFAGAQSSLYETLIRERLHADGVAEAELFKWFNIHLHRGISYLNRKCNSTEQLLSLAAG